VPGCVNTFWRQKVIIIWTESPQLQPDVASRSAFKKKEIGWMDKFALKFSQKAWTQHKKLFLLI